MMVQLLEIVFFLCVLAVLHSYLFFPWLLKLWTRNKDSNMPPELQEYPMVTIMMAVYNEASIIEDKLRSFDKLDYPSDRIRLFIGSDASDDGTNEIIERHVKANLGIRFFPFAERSGKVRVINRLQEMAARGFPTGPGHVYLFTDANVMLEPMVVQKLVRHFADPQIALVDTRMINVGSSKEDISISEEQYISREVLIKYREGLLGGYLMGPFGGCFALRSDYFEPVPKNFRVDDFFIAMNVMKKGGKVISDLDARVYEAIPHDIKEEYRRKRRISSGNFQNLSHFKSILWTPPFRRAFIFFSHKVLRWVGPLIMLLGAFALSLLAVLKGGVYTWIFLFGITGAIGIPILDMVLSGFGIHVPVFLHIRYFITMNIALLQGFIEYLKGIKTNVWQPPKRTTDL